MRESVGPGSFSKLATFKCSSDNGEKYRFGAFIWDNVYDSLQDWRSCTAPPCSFTDSKRGGGVSLQQDIWARIVSSTMVMGRTEVVCSLKY